MQTASAAPGSPTRRIGQRTFFLGVFGLGAIASGPIKAGDLTLTTNALARVDFGIFKRPACQSRSHSLPRNTKDSCRSRQPADCRIDSLHYEAFQHSRALWPGPNHTRHDLHLKPQRPQVPEHADEDRRDFLFWKCRARTVTRIADRLNVQIVPATCPERLTTGQAKPAQARRTLAIDRLTCNRHGTASLIARLQAARARIHLSLRFPCYGRVAA